MIEKRYIGDGVYADFDGYHIILTTEDGISETNRIALEPAVMSQLALFNKDLQSEKENGYKT